MVEAKNMAHITDIADGAAMEEIDVQLGRVVENLLDPNTDWKKKRSLTVKFDFSTDKNRELTKCEVSVDPKLAPSLPVETQIAFGMVNGQLAAQEISNQVAGQTAMDGSVVAEPPMIVVGGKKKDEPKQEVEQNA